MVKRWFYNGYPIIILLIILDQASKAFVLNYYPQFVTLNKGVSFGLFPSDFWVIVNLLILILIITFLKDNLAKNLIISGGLSNIIDRLIRGSVVDFINININFFGLSFPNFNLADIFVFCGVLILLHFNLTSKKD